MLVTSVLLKLNRCHWWNNECAGEIEAEKAQMVRHGSPINIGEWVGEFFVVQKMKVKQLVMNVECDFKG